MAVEAAKSILGHIHVLHPYLAVADEAKRIHKSSLTGTDALDLGTCQHDAGRKAVDDKVVVLSPTVLYIYLCGRFYLSFLSTHD